MYFIFNFIIRLSVRWLSLFLTAGSRGKKEIDQQSRIPARKISAAAWKRLGPWVGAPDRMGSRACDWLCGMPCRIDQNLRAGLGGSGRWLVRISRSGDAKIFARRDDSQLNESATKEGGVRGFLVGCDY